MARVPQSKPSVSPGGGSTPFQRGPGSAEAFGAGEARTEEERVRAGIRISEAMKAANNRVGQAKISAAQRTGAARAEAVNRIGAARAGAVTRVGAARAGATARTGAARAGAAGRTEQLEGAAALTEESLIGPAISEVGRSLTGVGEDVAAASARIRVRQESNERIRFLGEIGTQVQDLFAQEQNEGTNFGNDDSLKQFLANVDGILSEAVPLVGGHTADSQLLFLGELEKINQSVKSSAIQTGIQTNKDEESRHFQNFAGQQADIVSEDPRQIEVVQANIENRLIQLADTSTPEELAVKRDAAFSGVVKAVFDKALAVGDTEGAGVILNSDMAQSLTEVERRQANNVLLKTSFELIRTNAQAAARFARVEAALGAVGQSMTPAIVLALEGVPAGARAPQTVAERIAEVEDAVGPISADQKAKIAGVLIKDDPGRAARSVTQSDALVHLDKNIASVTRSVLQGEPDLDGLGALLTNLSIAQQADEFGDVAEIQAHVALGFEEMGIDIGDPAAVTQLTRDLLQQRLTALDEQIGAPEPAGDGGLGIAPVTPGVSGAATPALEVPTTFDPTLLSEEQVDLTVTQARNQMVQETFDKLNVGEITAERTVFDRADTFTGVKAGVARGVAALPGVSAGEFAESKKQVQLFLGGIISALRDSNRADKEREFIKQILAMEPGLTKGPEDFRDAIFGVYKGLFEMKEALDTAAKTAAPTDKAKMATRSSLIQSYMNGLMPHTIYLGTTEQKVKEVERFNELSPAGTRYMVDIPGEGLVEFRTRGPKSGTK